MNVGERLKSAVCTAEVIVVRIDDGATGPLLCGGEPMSADAAPAAPAQGGELLMGKRYSGGGVEVVVVRGGTGPLAVGDEVLSQKQAKPLPSSD
ncbi:hypothetical protein GQ85_03650 [Rhodococcus rhodochrous]|nr:hypothetical protein GQ85_03650 [Rhodococcus rhodochrous]